MNSVDNATSPFLRKKSLSFLWLQFDSPSVLWTQNLKHKQFQLPNVVNTRKLHVIWIVTMLEKCHSSKPYHLGAIPLLLLEETLAGAS